MWEFSEVTPFKYNYGEITAQPCYKILVFTDSSLHHDMGIQTTEGCVVSIYGSYHLYDVEFVLKYFSKFIVIPVGCKQHLHCQNIIGTLQK